MRELCDLKDGVREKCLKNRVLFHTSVDEHKDKSLLRWLFHINNLGKEQDLKDGFKQTTNNFFYHQTQVTSFILKIADTRRELSWFWCQRYRLWSDIMYGAHWKLLCRTSDLDFPMSVQRRSTHTIHISIQ